MTETIKESSIFRLFTAFAVFIILTFNRDLGLIYIALMFSDWVWWRTDSKVRFPFEKTHRDRGKNNIKALAAYGIFIALSMVLISSTQLGQQIPATIGSVATLLSTATPVLKNSIILTIVGWGIMVPIIETRFFHGRLQEGLAELLSKRTGKNVTLTKYNTQTILVILIVASLFTIFHLTAKNLETIPLMITFVFSLVSSALVIQDRETYSATILHIITNTVAVISGII